MLTELSVSALVSHIMETSRSWYLISCRYREDVRAAENVTRQDFECYRPIYRAERRRNGIMRVADDSFFPGYLFVRLDPESDNWYKIHSTRGVIGIVKFGGYPLPVADHLIDEIKLRLAEPDTFEPYLKPGERVRITDRPFSNLEAIFLANDGKERVILLLNMLQQDQKISLPISCVRKIG